MRYVAPPGPTLAGSWEIKVYDGDVGWRVAEGMWPAWSVRNEIAFEGPGGRLWIADPAGRQVRLFRPDLRPVRPELREIATKGHHDADWSPDGRSLVWEFGYPPRILIADRDGGNVRLLGPGRQPVFSPDGEWIAFKDDPLPCLAVMRTDGRQRRRLAAPPIPGGTDSIGYPSWQPRHRPMRLGSPRRDRC